VDSTKPQFSVLDPAMCAAILHRNAVGRLAFAHGAMVDIQPVHYVVSNGWLFGRTSAGEKLAALQHNWRVAFEVDEVDDLFEWRSVVVHGGFYLLSPEGSPSDAERWQRSVAALRTIIPETMTEDDPVPFRNILFGIAIQEMTGRSCTIEPHKERRTT
jgi:hypothetical protein